MFCHFWSNWVIHADGRITQLGTNTLVSYQNSHYALVCNSQWFVALHDPIRSSQHLMTAFAELSQDSIVMLAVALSRAPTVHCLCVISCVQWVICL